MTLDPIAQREKAKRIFNSLDIDFESYLREKEHEMLALRFWDITDLGSPPFASEREKRLAQIQEEVLQASLETSLEKFSAGTVLGALISAIRRYEGTIDYYEQYVQASKRLEHWSTLIITPELEPYLQNVLLRIQEAKIWLDDKTEKYFPLVEKIIQETVINKKMPPPENLLHTLQTFETEREIFFLVGGLLKTNPILHEKVKKHCNDLKIDFFPILDLFRSILSFLAEKSTDLEVRGFCRLFLTS
ncbi:MAG: hypothetical protein ACFFBD_00375 [Candidatus Hodarchaeota archaeon]